ncbi:hypothetical protein GUJ93_ZPchr0012g21924 [Zizania palustris]|uniref:Secreted protein n=1 Tax=Zizania palustris TaxID=103762 RepID=A0A8J6BW26_ZIZPA|nr:hypothetical protein GUJ93_ZPchr0012g21924 [Zizania palustris]
MMMSHALPLLVVCPVAARRMPVFRTANRQAPDAGSERRSGEIENGDLTCARLADVHRILPRRSAVPSLTSVQHDMREGAVCAVAAVAWAGNMAVRA